MLRLFEPHIRVEAVWELTPERLREWGINALLLDVDCTLTRYRQNRLAPETAAWLDGLRAEGIRLCLVSNGLGKRIEEFANQLGLPFTAKAMKPLPRGVWKALRIINAKAQESAIVGDQIFADVMAGRMAGIRTILVRPIHPEEEPWFTRLKRLPEAVVLKHIKTGISS